MTTNPVTVDPGLLQSSGSVRRLGLAATSGCDRVRVLVHHGADVSKVAENLFTLEPQGLSAAALSTGNQQEASLLRAGAAPLIELLTKAGRLAAYEQGFLDIRSLPTDRQVSETLRLIGGNLLGVQNPVHVLAQPTLEVELWGRTQRFRADFAVLPGEGRMSLGEKKTFHDFDADTDQPAMRALLDQGGAYYALLDQALRQAGQNRAADLVIPTLDAVLRGPRVFPLDVTDERDRTLRLLSANVGADLDDVAADAARRAGTGKLDVDFVEELDTHRGSHCKSCPLRNKCRDDAYSAADLTILSPRARAAAVPAASAGRAAAIVAGVQAPAPHEQALADAATATRSELNEASCPTRRFTA
jgi:hypothetical protein